MSDLFYTTRLRWSGGYGIAKLHGVTVALAVAPDLGAGPVETLDYTPEVGCLEIRQRACDPMREMTPAEIHAADALLRVLTGWEMLDGDAP